MSQTLDYKLPEHLAARRAAHRRQWGVQIVSGAIAVVCLVSAGFWLPPINAIRRERQLVIDPATIKGLPPDLALLGKLGTFRALVIDWASIRAERLKEEGKTYEALQLHETICALAPRFPKVWSNAAWNMAYNISVSQYTTEARWQWVRNGITILRDKGLLYNPNSVTLYKELAWIYWHKIGDFLDDDHLNYKRALAVEMENVLGPPPLALTEEEYFQWFKKIVDAPRDLTELIRTDAEINTMVQRLEAVGLNPDLELLGLVARRIRPEIRVSDLLEEQADLDPIEARRLELILEASATEPFDRLLAAIRSRVLREQLRFDVDWMWTLMVDRYGPLDWRNAFAHSLYWASWGDKVARGHENMDLNDFRNNARFVFFSLQQMVGKGKITLWPNFDDPFASYIELTPDLRYIPYLFDVYLRLGKEHYGDDPRFREGTPGPIYMTGFVTHMQNWIQLLYLEGGEKNVQQAEQYYAWLRKNNPDQNTGQTQERYLQTLDEFVMGDIYAQLQTWRMARTFVAGFIQRGLKMFSLGMDKRGLKSWSRARKSYDVWMIDTAGDRDERRKMQPFVVILRDEIEGFLQDVGFNPLHKAALWKNLPLLQRQMTYDHLRPYFARLCETRAQRWDVKAAFPEPPGMVEFRKTPVYERGRIRNRDGEQGERYKR